MKFVPKAITRSVASSALSMKKNSPTLFFAGGVIGAVGATVLACKATLKLHETLDEVQSEIEDVTKNNALEPDQDHYLDVAYVYGKSALKISKLYGPSIALGTVSIMALTGSHVTLVRRNAALSATVAAVSKAYDDYRARVREELGKEKELDIYHAVENRVVDKADGTKEIRKVVDVNRWSPYAKIFDESNPNWEKNAEYNRLFLITQQNHWNYKLQSRGHVFLNEVYDSLGFEHTKAGSVVGWVLGPDGDNHVDFGFFNAYSSDFIDGRERSVILDFNVDGVVFDKIGED